MSESSKAKWADPEYRALLTGRKQAPESVEKTAAAHRGRKRSPETRAKLREAWKLRKAKKDDRDSSRTVEGPDSDRIGPSLGFGASEVHVRPESDCAG